jgi:hypothetical protein
LASLWPNQDGPASCWSKNLVVEVQEVLQLLQNCSTALLVVAVVLDDSTALVVAVLDGSTVLAVIGSIVLVVLVQDGIALVVVMVQDSNAGLVAAEDDGRALVGVLQGNNGPVVLG